MGLLTIQKDARVCFTLEKSRFICTLRKAGDEQAALSYLAALKKEYWDATHNCYAYITGEGAAACQKSGDDGEPSGTAGLPMLEVLKKNRLHNVLAVATRYFGGIKLGAGGLARAYTRCAAEAVAAAGLARKQLMYDCLLYEPQETAGRLLNLLYDRELFSVREVEYSTVARITLRLEDNRLAQAQSLLAELTGRDVELTVAGQSWREVPVERLPTE